MDLRILPPPCLVTPPPVRAPATVLLQHAREGDRAQLLALRMEPARRDLLHRMGLVETRHIRVEYNDHRGRVVISLDGDLFLLGRRETAHILVRLVPRP